MVVPVSVDAQFRRLDKQLRELSLSVSGGDNEEVSVLSGEICNSCMLLLDKTINEVWQKKSEGRPGANKPFMYFPANFESPEKLKTKLQQYQMPNLERNAPDIFSLIESAQPYKGAKWLSDLHKVASIRHEDFPKVKKHERLAGIGLGRGQGLRLNHFVIDQHGNVDFSGFGVNNVTGSLEPIRVDVRKIFHSFLSDMGVDAYHFCFTSVDMVKLMVRGIFHALNE